METIINRGYKFKIAPTKDQKEFFLQSFGCARKIYNMYVDELYRKLEESSYQNGIIKKSELHLSKYTDFSRQFDYMKNVDAQCLSSAKMDFNNAIKKFNTEYDKKTYTKSSRKREKTLGIKLTFRDLKGMPRFKSIKNNDFSYRTYNQSQGEKWNLITLENSMLKIPKLKTLIKVKQHRPLPNNSIIKNCTVSMDNKGVFYVSLCVKYVIDIESKKSEKVLGLDYSQHDFYVDSNGKKANYPHYYRKSEEKLKKIQRGLSRKKLKYKNWYKQKQKITTLQRHIANQRLNWLHQESRRIAGEYDAVIVEDIDLRNMAQCLKLGKNVHDNGFGMFRTFLKYKLEEQGKQFIKIDKWFPSSKMCHCCGTIKEDLQLSDRWYTCDCGYENDRDYNAAMNIRDCGTRLLAW